MSGPIIAPVRGLPGVGSDEYAIHGQIIKGGTPTYLPRGGYIDGSESRDPGNTPSIGSLRPGLLMGLRTANGHYAPSVIGTLDVAYDGSTSLTLDSTAEATELIRREGSSGTFKLTGPPTAGGTVRTQTVTYSGVNTSNGVVTVTAVNAAAVWTLTPVDGTDGGTFKLKVTLPDGSSAITSAITFSATGATFQGNIDTALEALSILDDDAVSVASTDTTGVSVITWDASYGAVQMEVVDNLLTDGGVYEGQPTLANTTPGVDGRFIAGSFVQPDDGSETILSFLPDGWAHAVTDADGNSVDVPWPRIPIAGVIDSSKLVPWPSDTSLQAYVRSALNAAYGGQFVFDDKYQS